MRLFKKQHLWPEVKRVSVVKGDLVVELVDRSSRRIPIDQIPNFEILLQLIDQGVSS
jgi:hypothetical protein